MDINKLHCEWISLLDIQGAFLSLDVVINVFPQGLESLSQGISTSLREVYGEWCLDKLHQGIHRQWIKWVLHNLLEFPESLLISIDNDFLDYQLLNPQDNSLLLPIKFLPPQQKLEGILPKSHRSATTEMMLYLQKHNWRIGLLTNGEQWMLINAPRDSTCGFISWYSQVWLEEKVTLQSFISLLGIRRFLGVEKEDTLASLLERSIHSQQSVTDQLGYQVRKAIEILIRRIEIISQDEDTDYLKCLSPEEVYGGVMSVMLRLIFILTAEAKELLPVENKIYSHNYSLGSLAILLRDQADKYGEEFLSLRFDGWGRIVANFRLVFAGVCHQDLQMSCYQGELFNPDKYPFLEGRMRGSCWLKDWESSEVIKIDNRTILHVLEGISILRVRKPQGGYEPIRVSFKDLDVEQIGHVYESLLEHKIERASSTIVKLIGNKDELGLVTLEELEEKEGDELISYIQKITKRTANAIKKGLDIEDIRDIDSIKVLSISPKQVLGRFMFVCKNDLLLWERIKPFGGLIDWDSFEYPIVIGEGSLYLTKGEERRETGTHYTPSSLTQEVVKQTINPLIYRGCREGKNEDEWELISSGEILDLKICDLAVGSGAFLVQCCRYLGSKLVESWDTEEVDYEIVMDNGERMLFLPELLWERKQGIGRKVAKRKKENKEYQPLTESEKKREEEKLLLGKRLVTQRCLYGVDKNPMAIEMAKLSLWLETLQRDKPFTFIDHAIKVGDSLLGVGVRELLCWSLDVDSTQGIIGGEWLRQLVDEVRGLREKIELQPELDVEEKKRLLFESSSRLEDLKVRGDLLVRSYLVEGKSIKELQGLRDYLLMVMESGESISESVMGLLEGDVNPFHWELEFPEVFSRGGFDAIVSNPPFMGGYKISGYLGNGYREYLTNYIAKGKKGGQGDLCAYFFLRVLFLLNESGCCGLIATNTICQGDTREVGLQQLVDSGVKIYRGVSSAKWEGTASLEVSHVWMSRSWSGNYWLDGQSVSGITAFLTPPGRIVGNPYRLVANNNKSFQGSIVLGMGFVLTPQESMELIEKDERNKQVLFPYLNGEDLNTSPSQSPSRWVINFHDYPLSLDTDNQDKPKGPPYATDFPDCLDIVERLVKPERERKRDNGEFVLRKPLPQKWWIYGEKFIRND